MKMPTVAVTVAVCTLAMFSAGAIAGPDFHMIERARAEKRAQMEKQAADSKKCMADQIAMATISK